MIKDGCLVDILNGVCKEPRTRIFKAAIEEFAQRSYMGARTRAIAAKAKVNHAAISYYFGGKNSLYMEIISQITDLVSSYNKPFEERYLEVGDNPAAAKELLVDFIMSKVAPESEITDIWRCLLLIIIHEEIGDRTGAYEILYKKIFKPSLDFTKKLISVVSCNAISDENAKIMAHMLFGQIQIFNYSRISFKRTMAWKSFEESEILILRENLEAIIKKTFNL